MEATTVTTRAAARTTGLGWTAADWLIVFGAAVLAASLFLPWYTTDPAVPASLVNNHAGDVSAWDTHEILRILFLVIAAHAITHTIAVLRKVSLSWQRGYATLHAAVNGVGLVLFCGFIDRPGEPMSTIGLTYGYVVAVVAVLTMFVGALMRIAGTEKRRPPGALR